MFGPQGQQMPLVSASFYPRPKTQCANVCETKTKLRTKGTWKRFGETNRHDAEKMREAASHWCHIVSRRRPRTTRTFTRAPRGCGRVSGPMGQWDSPSRLAIHQRWERAHCGSVGPGGISDTMPCTLLQGRRTVQASRHPQGGTRNSQPCKPACR